MSERTMRVTRGLAAAAISTFVAAFSHVVAGGGAPGTAGLLLAVAFAAVLCVLLTRRTPSLPLLAASVALSQVAFHLLFGMGGGAGSGLVVASTSHHGHTITTLIPDAVAGSVAHGHDQGLMWVSHAVAALVTVIALRRGELALRALLALSRSRAAVVLPRLVATLRLVRRALHTVWSPLGTALAVARAGGRAVALEPPLLRSLGVVFARLRHRGPPSMPALQFIR